MLGELADLCGNPPWQSEEIHVPLVAMRGARGAEHHRRCATHLADVISGAAMVEVEGAGHFGPNTHPDDVAAVIRDVASRVGA